MLETMLRNQSARDRHQNAPLLLQREQYLAHKLEQGTSSARILSIAGMLLNIVRHLDLEELRPVRLAEIDMGAQRWRSDPSPFCHRQSSDESEAAFRRLALDWLRFHSSAVIPDKPSEPYEAIFQSYKAFLELKIAPGSLKCYLSRVTLFFRWAEPRCGMFSNIKLKDVDEWILSRRTAGFKPRSIASICMGLRGFFRFAESQGLTNEKISHGIVSPSVPRFDPEPKGPRWSDVRRILSDRKGDTPADVRGRAILHLCAIYGLRSAETANLMLSDIDWVEETLLIRRLKSARIQRFPLQYEVGDAIVQYLKKGRPSCSCRNLFVTLHPPYRPLTNSSIRTLFIEKLNRLKIHSPRTGVHALRHSCATQLLNKGSSLQEIADFLGHSDTSSVGIYAKCSLAAIRKVADFGLEGIK